MYIIKAQYKHNKVIDLEIVEDKEYVLARCLSYAFTLDDNWEVWYVKY